MATAKQGPSVDYVMRTHDRTRGFLLQGSAAGHGPLRAHNVNREVPNVPYIGPSIFNRQRLDVPRSNECLYRGVFNPAQAIIAFAPKVETTTTLRRERQRKDRERIDRVASHDLVDVYHVHGGVPARANVTPAEIKMQQRTRKPKTHISEWYKPQEEHPLSPSYTFHVGHRYDAADHHSDKTVYG